MDVSCSGCRLGLGEDFALAVIVVDRPQSMEMLEEDVIVGLVWLLLCVLMFSSFMGIAGRCFCCFIGVKAFNPFIPPSLEEPRSDIFDIGVEGPCERLRFRLR